MKLLGNSENLTIIFGNFPGRKNASTITQSVSYRIISVLSQHPDMCITATQQFILNRTVTQCRFYLPHLLSNCFVPQQ